MISVVIDTEHRAEMQFGAIALHLKKRPRVLLTVRGSEDGGNCPISKTAMTGRSIKLNSVSENSRSKSCMREKSNSLVGEDNNRNSRLRAVEKASQTTLLYFRQTIIPESTVQATEEKNSKYVC